LPSSRLSTEDPEEIGIDEESARELRAIAKLDAHFAAEVAAQRFEGLAIVTNIHQVAAGEARDLMAGLFRIGGDGNNSIGIRIAERRKQNAIDDAENGCVRADSEGEREDGYYGEAGVFTEGSEGGAHETIIRARGWGVMVAGCW